MQHLSYYNYISFVISQQMGCYLLKLSVMSPPVSPPISFAFVPYPFFEWYPQSNESLLNLGMKW
jgi:hypothetical protein